MPRPLSELEEVDWTSLAGAYGPVDVGSRRRCASSTTRGVPGRGEMHFEPSRGLPRAG